MTTTTTAPPAPSKAELLAAYDHAMRTRAATTGIPVQRLSGPVIARSPATDGRGESCVFYLMKDDRLTEVSGAIGSRPGLATVTSVAAALARPGSALVPIDAAARNALVALANRGSRSKDLTEGAMQAMRFIRYAAPMAMSSRIVTLTTALARKYYLPTGADTKSIATWAAAFGVQRDVAGLRNLFMHCVSGDPLDEVLSGMRSSENPMKGVRSADDAVWSASKYGGTGADNTALLNAEQMNEAWNAIQCLDPVNRDRAVIEGRAFRATPVRLPGADKPMWAVDGLAKIQTGMEVVVISGSGESIDAHMFAVGAIGQMTVVDGELFCSIGASPKMKGSVASEFVARLRGQHAARKDVIVFKKPFLGAAKKSFTGKWGRIHSVDHPTRDVPLDVSLAGM